MEAMSIIDIPTYQKKKLKKAFIGSNIDYKRFNIKDRKILNELTLNSKKANDTDNSDVTYEGEVAFVRVRSPRGVAHSLTLSVVGGKPISFAYIEIYGFGQGLKGSIARIDFKGSFFHFYEHIPKRWQDVYNFLQKRADEENGVRVTRLDVALDFNFLFPQNGESWINPAKSSKREIECYRHNKKWNSFGYLGEKNSGYGVRMYNKLIDIEKNEKEFWYGGKSKLPENWTRIEFEFYPPYSLKNEKEMINNCFEKVCGLKGIVLGIPFRPCFEFSIEKAYSYFERYAKNHGISMEELIDCIVDYHMQIQEVKYLGHDMEFK